MASTKAFLDYILDGLDLPEPLTYRPMMGEYILYYQGRVIGGVYDDRLLLKPTASAVGMIGEVYDLPYEGAKPMLAPDPDDKVMLAELIPRMADELPAKKNK